MAPLTFSLCLSLCLAAMAGAAFAQPPGTPAPVPGLCTGSNGAGIGCGYDVTKVDAFSLTVNPKRPVIEFEWCDVKCYEPAHWYDSDCLYCNYQLPGYNITYAVPTNVFVLPETEAGGCYEQSTQKDVDEYQSLVGNTEGHSGWFHSWSKTTVKYYSFYYKYDSSQSLQYKFLIWHSMVIPEFPVPTPTMLFKISVSQLPATYDNATYANFIDEWGTHYMSTAQMGGSALMTQYFHECFLSQYGGKYVYQESSSSFFGIFKSHSGSNSGYNHTDGNYKAWSNSTIKLLGGDADKYGDLNWTNPLSAADVQKWEDSIKDNMMPLTFSFQPLHNLVSDATVKQNMVRALTEYGASIKTQNDRLVNSLVPQDPHTKPAWCKDNPRPPAETEGARRLDGLPGCPALPGPTETARILRERTKAVEARRMEEAAAAQ
mmetsp:Transcript_4976/g.11527  ORF Transcript_4976/g.11527 Transcript_4976/m.11527 type:complete len:431 (-) Transcript_4976:38-1330(-)